LEEVWWHTAVIPALRRLRKKECKFKANLDYIVYVYIYGMERFLTRKALPKNLKFNSYFQK
jgi:hypothetical protein